MGIFSRPSSFSQSNRDSTSRFFSGISSPKNKSGGSGKSSSNEADQDRSNPLFLCFSSASKANHWRSLLKTYARPHVFGSDSSLEKGGSHRWYRQIDLTVFEARSAGPVRLDHHHQNHNSGTNIVMSDADSKGSGNEDQDIAVEPRSLDEAIAAAQEQLDKKQAAAAAAREIGAGNTSASASASLSSRDEDADLDSPRSSFNATRPITGRGTGTGDENASLNGSANSTSAGAGGSKSDSGGNDDQYASGPVAGAGSTEANQSQSTANSQQQPPSSAPFSTNSYPAGVQAFSSIRRTSEPNSGNYFNAPVDSYCMVIASGHVAAKTKVRTSSPISGGGGSGYGGGSGSGGYSDSNGGSGSVVWVERFSLPDLPDLSELRIDVLQSARSSNTSGQSGNSSTNQNSSNINKTNLLGCVEIPIETIRRGEEIDGWFPIWSYTSNSKNDEDGLTNLNLSAGSKIMIGELKMIVKVREETILPLRKYQEIEKALNDNEKSTDLIYKLSKHLDEDAIISHLVDVYTSSGTIVQRLADLAERESNMLGDQPESELLFR